MADKELGITVTGNLSDIEAKIQELTSLLNGVNDVNIGADADFEGVKGELANLQETLTTLDNEVVTPEVSAEGIADVSTEAESASGDMQDLGESGEEAGSMIEGGMAIASLAVLALGSDVEETAQKLGDLSVSYSKLGSSFEGGSAALRDQVANITDTEFPEDEALTYISLLKRMGVAQEDLVDSSDDLNKIRSATQSSVDDMTPLLQGLRSMNYDVSNLEGAYNALYFANAKYVGGLPAFSSDLKKYGSYFEDMGLNIDQAAVVLVEAQRKWPNPREMRTNLKAALDESGGDVNKFADALGISSDKIQNAGTVTGEYAGKIETVSQQYEQTATTTEKVNAATADLNTRYGEITKTIYDAGGAVYTFTKTIGEAWLIAKAAFKVGILEEDYAAKFIEKPLMKGVDFLKQFGGKAADTIKGWGKWADDIGGIFSRAGGKMKIPTTDLTSGLDDMFAQMSGAAPKAEEAGGLIPKGIGKGVTKYIGEMAGKLATPVALVQMGIDAIYNIGDNFKKENPLSMIFQPILDFFPQFIQDTANWILTFGGLFTYEKMFAPIIGQGGAEGITTWLTDNIQTPFREFFDNLFSNPPAAYETAVGIWNDFVRGFMDSFPNIEQAGRDLQTKIDEALKFLGDLPGRAWQWGWDTINSWKSGIASALEGTKGWLEEKLSPITNLLEGHSPPKEGPLSEIDVWGQNIGRSFIEGIGAGITGGTGLITNSLTNLGGQFGLSNFSLPSPAVSGLTQGSMIPVTINLTLPAMSSREEAVGYGEAAGQAAGESLAKVLQGQASNAGVNVYNVRR